MGGEKATRWLTYRYAAQRYAQLDSSPETAPGMVARHAYSQLLPAMRDSLMPVSYTHLTLPTSDLV